MTERRNKTRSKTRFALSILLVASFALPAAMGGPGPASPPAGTGAAIIATATGNVGILPITLNTNAGYNSQIFYAGYYDPWMVWHPSTSTATIVHCKDVLKNFKYVLTIGGTNNPPPGSELVFGIRTPSTDTTNNKFFTGPRDQVTHPATANPDNHAMARAVWTGTGVTVGFEDNHKTGTDWDFDDCMFRLCGPITTCGGAVAPTHDGPVENPSCGAPAGISAECVSPPVDVTLVRVKKEI